MRSAGDPAALAPLVREAVRAGEPGAAIEDVRTLSAIVGEATSRPA